MTRLFKNSYMILVYLFFYLPIMVVIIFSFNNATYSSLWHGFTLKWYPILFHDRSLLIAALHSLIIGTLASSTAALLGTITATALFRYRFFGKPLLHGLLFFLIIVPDIVLAIAFLILFSSIRLQLGFWSLLFAHITFCLPFVTIIVFSRMNSFDKFILEAAKDLGANDYVIFKKIIIPLMWPAILVGWLLSFTLSIDDVIISYFVTGPTFDVLPLKIYSMVRTGIKPEINALCTLLIIATFIIVGTTYRLLHKK